MSWQTFFKEFGDRPSPTVVKGEPGHVHILYSASETQAALPEHGRTFTVEELYQAFKERLESERGS